MFNFLKNAVKELDKLTYPNRNTNNKEIVYSENKEINKIYKENNLWRGIYPDEKIDKQIERDLLDLEYRDIYRKAFAINEYDLYNKIYSKAINNKKGIFNKYSDDYIKLAEEYLQLLPELTMYYRKLAKIENRPFHGKCHRILKQYILLLDKQEKYVKEYEVIHFLLEFGIEDDGTKGGLISRAQKLTTNMETIVR